MTATLIRTDLDGKYDAEKIINAMLLAFSADPFIRWLYPSVEQYLNSFPGFVRLIASDRVNILYTKDYAGAAFWLPPETEVNRDAYEAYVTYIRKTVCPSNPDQIDTVFEKLVEAHPQVPHRYLALLGVEPTKQGQGYGTSLLEPILQDCDRQQQVLYLETCNPRSAAFYERHGFEPQATIQIAHCPLIFPMVRYPQ